MQSSQEFVRSLKAPLDPPVEGGPTKIEIAQEAWSNVAFYVPSKGEVIAEWILTKLLKEKDKTNVLLNPIFDARYWRLLYSIWVASSTKSTDHRHLKTWLTPLLHRIPLAPVIVAFFAFLHALPDGQAEILSREFTSCISVLWPIAVQKMNTEVLLGCFGSFLKAVPLLEELKKVGLMITASYRSSLGNSSNKRKLYQTFLQNHFHSWLEAQPKFSGTEAENANTAFLSAGIDTLLNLDVLRQTYDCKPDSLLMQQLQSIAIADRALVHEFVPVLFAHYIQALSKHRTALFGQSSHIQPGAALDQVRQCSMNFFSVLSVLVSDQEHEGSAWQTRLALLGIANKENVFTGKHAPSQMTMHKALESMLGALSDDWNEVSQRTTLAIQCLSMITRIDQDLVSPILSKLLSRLLQIPESSDPYFEFLGLLLDHHTKTRTMHVLIENLFESISSASISHSLTDAQAQYQALFSSAVMHDIFLEKMSKAIHNFMTENQCVTTTKHAFEAVKNAWELAYEGTKEKEEKRKSMSMDVDNNISALAGESSVRFALITRLASVVLSSLPTHSLSPSTLQDVQKSLLSFRSDVLHHDISKCLKALKKKRKKGSSGSEKVDVWAIEIMLSALLRILYAMNVSRNLTVPTTEVVEKNHARLIEVMIPSEDLLPELTLEVFRTLLFDLSVGAVSRCEEIIGHLLDFLEKNFQAEKARWSGQGYRLTHGELGRRHSSLALLCMVVDRWLPEIDSLASSGQTKQFLKLIMSIKFKFSLSEPLSQQQGLQPGQLLLHILHSAQFWEFGNIRSVFLDLLKEMTLEAASPSVQNFSVQTLIGIASLYRLLLFFPMEYFSWQVLSRLIKSALGASSALVNMSDSLDRDFAEGIVVFRVFLNRAYGYSGLGGGSDVGMDQAELLLDLLREPPMMDSDVKEGFENATLDLAEIYLFRLLKSSKKSGPEALLRVFRVFESESFGRTRTLSSTCFIRLVNLLGREFHANSSVPEDVVQALGRLHDAISSRIGPDVVAISQVNLLQDAESWLYVDIANLWYTCLCLRKWSYNGTVPHQQMTFVGDKIVSVLMPLVLCRDRLTAVLAEICTTAFAILLRELESMPVADERSRRLEVVVAIYVSLSNIMPAAGLKEMDAHLGGASKLMPVVDYVHLLSFIANSLSSVEHLSSARTLSLVHLGSLLLCDHPSHSFPHIQKFMSQCLGIFNHNPLVFVTGDSRLRLQVLEMVVQCCSDQHAALRTQDTSMILLLISNFLAPSGEHDQETQFGIFHRIVSILTSLIRLRRDLVVLSLPHLGLILRRLLLCLRGSRPNLGAKQTALVMNTQPRWICCSTHPLGGEEAKALGRLLENLDIKTTVRIHTSSSTPSSSLQEPPPPPKAKAESLARPFSKHAAYVLKAYIEAMSDPLCVMSLEVRKELKEGLFALCGMMSVHSRDALMIGGGLDAGGKVVLKSVWKEWEAVRYVGKG